jgi:hypothetical protein
MAGRCYSRRTTVRSSTGPMLYGLGPHRSPILVGVGDPLRLSAGPATRRTVAAAADEIHRALAAHVAARRPAPAEPERDPP